MKYMGSKRAMLTNGLGSLIVSEATDHDRVVDLFCGGASVAWFAAENTNRPVLACDLQAYSIALATAVLRRTREVDKQKVEDAWLGPALRFRDQHSLFRKAQKLDQAGQNTATWAKRAKALCAKHSSDFLIWRCYGGHYFSPSQAVTFDALRQSLPNREPTRSLCLASLIISASKCVASPGHTAQPFKATRTAGAFLREAWCRSPERYVRSAVEMLASRRSRVRGTGLIGNAIEIAKSLKPGDLVFVDPPYSAVHYSRFYHVLETIARGECGEVGGTGRYPPPEERPMSAFSRITQSQSALSLLLQNLSQAGCTVILTFPAGQCSNGLSGRLVVRECKRYFDVKKRKVKTQFSTLGGNNDHRGARKLSSELILLLTPR